MDIVQLPVLPALSGLEEAWSVLVNAKRSALITEHRGSIHLISARDIIVGQAKGRKRLTGLVGTNIPILFEPLVAGGGRTLATHLLTNLKIRRAAGIEQIIERHISTDAPLGKLHRELPWQKQLADRLEPRLWEISGGLALVGIEIGIAYLATASEQQASLRGSSPKACYCSKIEDHHVTRGARTGDECGTCGANIACKR